MLRIESEWLEVVVVDATGNTLTVRRGVNGSAAADHAQNTAIEVFEADGEAVRALARWVALHLQRRGAFEQVTVQGFQSVQFPADAPDEVQHIVSRFAGLFDVPFLEV